MNLRIAVVGSGAIGSYYGTKLACSGGDVHFLMRGDLSEIRRAGLCIQGSGENFHLAEVNCYNSTKEIGPCDLILISVKATSISIYRACSTAPASAHDAADDAKWSWQRRISR